MDHQNDQISHNDESMEIDHEILGDRNEKQLCSKDHTFSEKLTNQTIDPNNALTHDTNQENENGNIISLGKDSDEVNSNVSSSTVPNVNVENLLMEVVEDDNFQDAVDNNDSSNKQNSLRRCSDSNTMEIPIQDENSKGNNSFLKVLMAFSFVWIQLT